MKIEFTEPTLKDIEYVAYHLNPPNEREILPDTMGDPQWSVDDMVVSLSKFPDGLKVHCLKVDGVPIVIGGFAPSSRKYLRNCVWAYVSKDVQKHKLTFMRIAKAFVEFGLTHGYAPFGNVTPADNDVIIKWVKSLGAKVSEPVHIDGTDLEWCEFYFGEVE